VDLLPGDIAAALLRQLATNGHQLLDQPMLLLRDQQRSELRWLDLAVLLAHCCRMPVGGHAHLLYPPLTETQFVRRCSVIVVQK